MRDLIRVLIFTGLMSSTTVAAELVVIVNAESGVESLDNSDLVNIFMGRYQKLPSGITAFPVDLNGERQGFYKILVDKTLPEINSYWARLVFSGRASPPRQVHDAKEVVEIVSSNRGAIGYVDRALVTSGVTIVHSLSPRTARLE